MGIKMLTRPAQPKTWLKMLVLVMIILVFLFKIYGSWPYKRYTDNLDSFLGDEPKYIRMIHSLLQDGDLNVSNFWGSKEEIGKMKEKALASGTHKFAGLYVFGKKDGIYSLHLPGLAFLAYPGYMLDSLFYYRSSAKASKLFPFLPSQLYFVRLSLIVIAILSILLLFRLLDHVFSSPLFAAVLFIPLILNSAFPLIAIQLYPDSPAMLFCLLALNCIFYPFNQRTLNDFFLIIGIGFLPWLHYRFIPLSIVLYLVFLFFPKKGKLSLRRMASVSFFLFLSSLPYFYYFYSITGNPSPLSISQLYGESFIYLSTLPLGFFGQFFSTKEGMLWIYPWTILFFSGVYWGPKKNAQLGGTLLFIFFPYYLLCSAGVPWSGVSIPVGRYSLVLIPVYLIFVGFTLDDLSKRFSYKKMFFYLAFFALLLINRKFSLLRLDFGYTQVNQAELTKILIAMLLLLLFYISLFFGEKWLFKNSSPGQEKS